MQSPAGYLCILLTVFAMIATPIAEKKLWETKRARLLEIGAIPPDDTPPTDEEVPKPEQDFAGVK